MKNIIVRKNYTSSDIRSFIKVNEIIILKGDSSHNLLSLKMFNAFKENAKTIKMFITQYDKYGNKIDASYFEYSNLGINTNDFFVPKKYLSLNVNISFSSTFPFPLISEFGFARVSFSVLLAYMVLNKKYSFVPFPSISIG